MQRINESIFTNDNRPHGNMQEKYIMGKGYTMDEKPKSYKQIDIMRRLEDGRLYTIYSAKDQSLRYSVYVSGCFKPYYGKLTSYYGHLKKS